ncbi:hypothetical protein Droror1_Dr00017134 [Drosera rotundifolia]
MFQGFDPKDLEQVKSFQIATKLPIASNFQVQDLMFAHSSVSSMILVDPLRLNRNRAQNHNAEQGNIKIVPSTISNLEKFSLHPRSHTVLTSSKPSSYYPASSLTTTSHRPFFGLLEQLLPTTPTRTPPRPPEFGNRKEEEGEKGIERRRESSSCEAVVAAHVGGAEDRWRRRRGRERWEAREAAAAALAAKRSAAEEIGFWVCPWLKLELWQKYWRSSKKYGGQIPRQLGRGRGRASQAAVAAMGTAMEKDGDETGEEKGGNQSIAQINPSSPSLSSPKLLSPNLSVAAQLSPPLLRRRRAPPIRRSPLLSLFSDALFSHRPPLFSSSSPSSRLEFAGIELLRTGFETALVLVVRVYLNLIC